jgi:hypothetical protein
LVIREIAAIDRDNLVTVCLAANRQMPSLQSDCEVGLVVRIRYSELQSGLHVDARTQGGDTVVYLLPGLTPAERRVALTRVRSFSRLGHGPRLSSTSLLVAVGVDRIRTTLCNGAAAVRGHPILLLPSALVMSGTAFALVSLAAVTFHLPAGNVRPVSSAVPRTPVGFGSQSTHRHVRPPARRTNPRAQAHAWREYQHRALMRTLVLREMPPRTYWRSGSPSGWSPSALPPGPDSCVVYGVFGVCENS